MLLQRPTIDRSDAIRVWSILHTFRKAAHDYYPATRRAMVRAQNARNWHCKLAGSLSARPHRGVQGRLTEAVTAANDQSAFYDIQGKHESL